MSITDGAIDTTVGRARSNEGGGVRRWAHPQNAHYSYGWSARLHATHHHLACPTKTNIAPDKRGAARRQMQSSAYLLRYSDKRHQPQRENDDQSGDRQVGWRCGRFQTTLTKTTTDGDGRRVKTICRSARDEVSTPDEEQCPLMDCQAISRPATDARLHEYQLAHGAVDLSQSSSPCGPGAGQRRGPQCVCFPR